MTFADFIAADPDSAYIEEQMRREEAGEMTRTELYAFYGEGGTNDFMQELDYLAEEDE